ncbi:MAG: hypothetical protein JXX28_17550 [Deltaproteobacteria bacterium]|nr:hypothetical protein [Deltaproteobacteria bacterium]
MFHWLTDFLSLLLVSLLGAGLATVGAVWLPAALALAGGWLLSGAVWAAWREHDLPGHLGPSRIWILSAAGQGALQGVERLRGAGPPWTSWLLVDLIVATALSAWGAALTLRLIRSAQ